MKKLITALAFPAFMMLISCGGNEPATSDNPDKSTASATESTPVENEEDYSKGIGKFKDVVVSPTLDVKLASAGKDVYELKCSSCHKLSGPRLVGPSWDGVTSRREPTWILNFVTNVDEMLSKDPEAIAQLEECLIRMPNQNLSDEDAFAVLEFMRENDGVK